MTSHSIRLLEFRGHTIRMAGTHTQRRLYCAADVCALLEIDCADALTRVDAVDLTSLKPSGDVYVNDGGLFSLIYNPEPNAQPELKVVKKWIALRARLTKEVLRESIDSELEAEFTALCADIGWQLEADPTLRLAVQGAAERCGAEGPN